MGHSSSRLQHLETEVAPAASAQIRSGRRESSRPRGRSALPEALLEPFLLSSRLPNARPARIQRCAPQARSPAAATLLRASGSAFSFFLYASYDARLSKAISPQAMLFVPS